jgi:hypothetical protein
MFLPLMTSPEGDCRFSRQQAFETPPLRVGSSGRTVGSLKEKGLFPLALRRPRLPGPSRRASSRLSTVSTGGPYGDRAKPATRP